MMREFFAAGTLGMIGLLTIAGHTKADDLVTLSGTTYRDVRAVRVEPDGITWQHQGGVAKVDFADCPETVRRSYHYDPAKATAYRDAQTQARLQADEQAQKLVRAHEEHQRERVRMTLQNTSETPPASDGNTAFTLRRRLDSDSTAAAAAVLEEQAQTRKAARELLTKDNGTVWDNRLWAVPRMIFGSSDGTGFEPGANLNVHEFSASLHHTPGGYPPSCMQDNFYTPAYMTKSYYEDVDRAEAFARGVPLK